MQPLLNLNTPALVCSLSRKPHDFTHLKNTDYYFQGKENTVADYTINHNSTVNLTLQGFASR